MISWLLAIDNLGEKALSVIERWLPRASAATSWPPPATLLRRPALPPLEPLPLDDATRFLLDRSGHADGQQAILGQGKLGRDLEPV